MDYKELIEISQKAASEWRNDHTFYQAGMLIDSLCRSIEALLAERDAVIERMHGECRACINADVDINKYPCNSCRYISFIKSLDADRWQWRGVQKENGHIRCPGDFGGTK